jgi:PKD repeat protein
MKLQSITLAAIMLSFLFTVACEKEPEENPNNPTACFVPPDVITAGEPVMFLSSCSENAITHSWSFGDGSTSADANPMHTYSGGGEFTVTLTVDNGEGETDEQTVVITVQVPSVIEHSGNISDDETWIEGVHLIVSDVYVDGATLTIEPGAVVMFASGRGLYFGYNSGSSGATLVAEGTADKPITFTSSAATKSPGDWDYIGFYEGASSISTMQHCVVEYGGGFGSSYGEVHLIGSSVSMDHCIIRYSGAFGVSLNSEAYFESFSENELVENGSNPISIYANYVHTLGEGNTYSGDKPIHVEGDELEQPEATWLAQSAAYFIDGDLYIGSATGTNLMLDPGVEVRVGSGSGIYVGYYGGTFGTVTASGTESDPVVFTSAAQSGSKSPGDWDGIWFDDGAGTASVLDYCVVEYGGGYSQNYGMIHVAGSGVSVTNSTISYSESMGISLDSESMFMACSDNTFEGNSIVPIEIYGNYAHTIGQGNSYLAGPGILLAGDRVEQADVSWTKQEVPYIVDNDMYVGSETGAKLTIEPGTTIQFTESSGFYVGYYSGTFGILVADGDPDNLITFTSGAPEGFKSAGDWDGIWFYDGTGANSMMDHCVVSYGGGYSNNSGNLSVVNENPGVPVVSNSVIENSAAWGIYVNNSSSPELTEVTYTNNALGDVSQ